MAPAQRHSSFGGFQWRAANAGIAFPFPAGPEIHSLRLKRRGAGFRTGIDGMEPVGSGKC